MASEGTPFIEWQPIEPLGNEELRIDVAEFDSMAAVWSEAQARLREQNPEALTEFYEQLRRSWAIETGILENLFMIDRGTTQTLIDRGFHQELINRTATDMDPGRLVALLKDHLTASDMIQSLIEDESPLTVSFILELQSLLTRHQPFVEGIDTLGHPSRVEPERGKWKTQPNYRELPTGEKRFYCPPEQVPGQIQELLGYLDVYLVDDVSICLVAAWLHHRFTLIHPFQDGNGRMARALVNYLFVRAGLFPVVIDRDQKSEYVDALASADQGKLDSLVKLLSIRQVTAIKQAISLADLPEDHAIEQPVVKELARGIAQLVKQREAQEEAKFRGVNQVVAELWEVATDQIRRELDEFSEEMRRNGLEVISDVDRGGSQDGREHYYRWEVIESARQAQQWANFNEEARWLRVLVRLKSNQLRVVFSLHHVGRALTGVAEVTSIGDLEDLTSPPPEEQRYAARRPVHCMLQPFSFTWRDKPEDLKARFRDWCRDCLLMGLRAWGETV